MPHLKGMDTWLWVTAGVIVSMLCLVLFLQIFSSMTIQDHTQKSLESQSGLQTDINKLCDMGEGEGMSQTLKISVLATGFFASDNGTPLNSSGRTYGKKLCMNISGVISCQDLGCLLEMDDLIAQKKVLNFIDRMRGDITYREYDVNIVRTKCGVSVLSKGSGSPGCICASGTFEKPMYCNYNGQQPLMLVKDKAIILTDAQTWTAKDSNSSPDSAKLYSNIANYLGGVNILVLYEENLTDPNLKVMQTNIELLRAEGFWINVNKHSSSGSGGSFATDEISQSAAVAAAAGINFSPYDQVWLITPGFCEGNVPGCPSDYAKWTVTEKNSLIDFAKSGKGILIVTDSSMMNGTYRKVNLNLINSIMQSLGFPYEQVLSCVCGCDGQAMKAEDTIFENHTLTEGVKNISVSGAAVLKDICTYSFLGGGGAGQASCSADGLCAKNCPAGDPDCSCLEQNGNICIDKKQCREVLLNNTGSKFCCSAPCLSNPSGCQNTSDVPEGGTCACTGDCMTNMTCDKTKHCCSSGTQWNGTNCTKGSGEFKLIVVPLSGWSDMSQFKSKANECFNRFITLFPFKECSSGSVELVLVEKACSGSISAFVSSNSLPNTLSCARNAGAIPKDDPSGNKWRVIGIENSNGNVGGFVACSGGITDPQCKMATASVGPYWGRSCSAFLHEVGHTFGLCGEYCGSGTCDGPVYFCGGGKCPSSCAQINKPASNPTNPNCVMNNKAPTLMHQPCYDWVRDKGLPMSIKGICKL